MIPGELFVQSDPIQANAGRETVEIEVANTAGRPIQVGSHFHFFEANKALVFPRRLAFGKHLNIPAGTAVRFEPGDRKTVILVTFAGTQEIYGLNSLTQGPATEATRQAALERAHARGFGNTETAEGDRTS